MKKVCRPRIKINLDQSDRIIEILGLFGLILLIGLPIYFYSSLPEMIPRHYGFSGEPDGFSGKDIIWILPIIGSVMYIGMAILNKYPYIFNYLKEITEENAERQYRIATKLIRILNTQIACIFAYLTYATIQTALGNQSGLGTFFMPLFLLLIFGPIGYYLYRSLKVK